MLSWETGVQFGQALEQIKSHEVRLSHVEAEVATIKTLVYRGALVASLWSGGLLLNVPADRVGEYVAAFLKLTLK